MMNDTTSQKPAGKKIWIDLDNSPHVPFFVPIIQELERRGCSVFLTARDCFQVVDLLGLFDLKCRVVGRHYGRHKIMKVAGTCLRGLQLTRIAVKEKPDLAISHGSRSQLLSSALLRIPNITIFDYEFVSLILAKLLRLIGHNWLMAPELISSANPRPDGNPLLKYPGIKEDVYVPWFKPDPAIKTQLGLQDHELTVTVRPPATEAHYHNPESERLFTAVMNFLLKQPDPKIVLVPRNQTQADRAKKQWPDAFAASKIIIPDRAVDGLNLIWYSDLVIGGGGTMNREAAALGVPVFSIFRGHIGAVDQYLAKTGRLTLIESVDEIRTKIMLVRRNRPARPDEAYRPSLQTIVNYIVAILESKCPLPSGSR